MSEHNLSRTILDKVLNTDSIHFFQSRLRRAEINLEDARNRRDTRAANNIQRKIDIYHYVLGILIRIDETGGEDLE